MQSGEPQEPQIKPQQVAAGQWRADWLAWPYAPLVVNLAILLLCTVLTLVVYGAALGFAFTFDDPLDLPRAEGRSVWSLFSSSEGYAYYRPIPFVVWKIARTIQGHYSEAMLHGLTLICHILSAWLLALLLRRLTGTYWGVLAAILFITYPFSYQAVFGAHTLFHPLMTAALLLALLLYLAAREAETIAGRDAIPLRAGLLYGAAFLATLVGLWTHETGVIILPLIGGLEVLLSMRDHVWRPQRMLLRVIPFAVAAIAFLLVWRAVPKFARPDPWSPASLLPNARYLLQGVIWPVAAELNRLGERFGVAPDRLLWGAIALTLLCLVGVYALGRRLWVPLVVLGATAIILFPAWLVLTWGYLEDAPRLLYPAAPAIAALWGLLPSLRFSRQWATWSWRVVTLLLLGALFVQNLNFINLRRDMWAEGTTLIHAIADIGAEQGERPLLFLNVPAWFAPKNPEYPVGHVGLTALPGYIGLGRSIYIHRGVQPPVESRGYYPDLNGWKYDFNTHGAPATTEEFGALVRQVDRVYNVQMTTEGARVREIGSVRPNGATRPGAGARFADGLILQHAQLTVVGAQLDMDLTWDVVAPVPGDVLPVMRVQDRSGQVVAELRQYPLGNIAAPRLWQVGDRVHDLPTLALPADLPAGRYRITLVWEERTTGVQLAGVDADGQPLGPLGLVLGEFQQP